MFFLTEEELGIQNIPVHRSSKILFKNKFFTRGPDFAKNSREAAISFCHQKQTESNVVCLLVEHQLYLTVWIEQKTKTEISQDTKTSTKSPKDDLLDRDLDFVNRCQRELAEIIGPIATIVCQRTITKNPAITKIEFVKALAEQIPDRTQAKEFQQRFFS
jgi:hypothetical protein